MVLLLRWSSVVTAALIRKPSAWASSRMIEFRSSRACKQGTKSCPQARMGSQITLELRFRNLDRVKRSNQRPRPLKNLKTPMTRNNRGTEPRVTQPESSYWFVQHSKSVIFLIITVALLGGYLAFTIPVSVFPTTNFPRILIAVDNGVMPIDQMMVTITRPIEEDVHSVPRLLYVKFSTSRGY